MKSSMFINNVLLVYDLKHNLLTISQLCDSENNVVFYKDQCIVYHKYETKMFVVYRRGNLYEIDMDELLDQNVSCLMLEKDDHWP